jgi:hypothetical protein
MYLGNEKIRHESETWEYTPEQIQEFKKCSESVEYFAENYCYIRTLNDGEILIPLRGYQRKLLRLMSGEDIDETIDDPKYNLIIKQPRQSAKSSTTAIYCVWLAIFHKDKYIAILANTLDMAIELMTNNIKLIYENLPYFLQIGVKNGGWNKKSIVLSNNSRIVVSASTASSVRGRTVSLLIIDECAHVKGWDEFEKSVFPTISSGKGNNAKIFLISTSKGMNHFYRHWSNAKKGKGDFIPFEVDWRDVPRDEDNDDYKSSMIEQIGVISFAQEYECICHDSLLTVDIGGVIKTITVGELYELMEKA